jgi:3-methyladenine DNA glycosylase/8-oxoguanine DNA glycosylase
MFEYLPAGPFDLANQSQYFGGWPTLASDPNTVIIAFPVEGWQGSAAVSLRQREDGSIVGQVFGPPELSEKAREQALACLSLDIDAKAWPAVGQRDPVIGALQDKYHFVRPTLFHSPYEAAAGFIIGHRITIKQKNAIMQRMAAELGQKLDVDGQQFCAFPEPGVLLGLEQYQSLSTQKIERLHAIALAALDGWLDRAALRSLPITAALSRLETLPGVGPFFSQGILHRGAGLADDITRDDLTFFAIQSAYHLDQPPGEEQLLQITRDWQPFRMWATVLLHIWVRREIGVPPRRTLSKR